MASNIFLIYSLVAFNSVFLACDTYALEPYSTIGPIFKETDSGNEEVLLQVYVEIENFKDKMNNVTGNLLGIKNGLESELEKLANRAENFKSRIQFEDYVYEQELPPANTYGLRHLGCNCFRQEITDNCAYNLLNKTEYMKYIDMFLKILFTGYKETLKNFARELEEMTVQLDVLKMTAYINYAEHKLNGTELIKSKMADWQNEKFKELEIYWLKQFFKAKELIESLKTLINREQKFENTIFGKIKDTRLAYVCCKGGVHLEVVGLECNRQTENATVDELSTRRSDH